MAVSVRIIEISWLSKNLRQLYTYMAGVDDDKVFDTELIRVLLSQQSYSNQLILRVFLPWCIYMACTVYYLSNFVKEEHTGGFWDTNHLGLRLVIFILIFGFIGIEGIQMVQLKLHYLKDAWNYVYLGSYAMNMCIILQHTVHVFDMDSLMLIQLSAIATILLWANLYYWMRLFDHMAFYVMMIRETLSDIAYFLLMFLMCICMFANAIYILDITGDNETAEARML